MMAMPSVIGRWAAGQHGGAPAATVVRILGARELLQGVAVAVHPARPVVRIGIFVDLSHAATMAAAIGLFPRYRRPAALGGVLAAASAMAGTVALRRGRR